MSGSDSDYPKYVWYFLAGFLGLLVVGNIFSLVSLLWRKQYAQARRSDAEGSHGSSAHATPFQKFGWAVMAFGRAIGLRSEISLGNNYSVNLIEVAVVLAYCALIFVATFINTDLGKATTFMNRAAYITASQLPLVVALSMRNNIISLFTGISFERLNFFHRMAARALTILIWVHAGSHLNMGGSVLINFPFARWGITALVAFTLATILFVRPVREAHYEVFYVAHFTIVFTLILGAYHHTKYSGHEYYVWPCWVLWGFDRLLRVIRIFLFNRGYFLPGKSPVSLNATVEPVTSTHIAFLTMPSVSMHPFESHPFTIATADVPREKEADASDLVFVVKAKEGFTSRLLKAATKGESLRVCFDGPYGEPPSLHYYDTVVLAAGGSGVSFTMSHFLDILHRARKQPSICRSIIFIWAIRKEEHINLIYSDLVAALANVPASLSVSIRIHITSAQPPKQQGISTGEIVESAPAVSVETTVPETIEAKKIASLPFMELQYGRPEIRASIEEAASLAQGPVAVAVCGPDEMAMQARSALLSPSLGLAKVTKGGYDISLFVDTFRF